MKLVLKIQRHIFFQEKSKEIYTFVGIKILKIKPGLLINSQNDQEVVFSDLTQQKLAK